MKHDLTFAAYAARLREFIQRSSHAPCDHLPSKQKDDEFNELALSLFALHFEHIAPYQRFCQGRNVSPEKISSWTQISAVHTSAFKELEMTSLSPSERTTVFHSSGTTEHRPSRHFHNAESLALYEASLLSWFRAHMLSRKTLTPALSLSEREREKPPTSANQIASQVISKGTEEFLPLPRRGGEGRGEGENTPKPDQRHFPFVILTPPAAQAPHSSLVHMFEAVRREFGSSDSAFAGAVTTDGAWTLNFDQTISSLRASAPARRPLALLGTAFSFVHLLDQLAERGIRLALPPGSRALETGGYKGRSRSLPKHELHQLITEFLGIPITHIVCEYGMSELSSQAYDWAVPSSEFRVPRRDSEPHLASRLFRFPPWARAQIISPETGREVGEGETGLIRVYDLANVRSVMAIQTEDLGVRRGNGFELLGRAAAAELRGCSLMTA